MKLKFSRSVPRECEVTIDTDDVIGLINLAATSESTHELAHYARVVSKFITDGHNVVVLGVEK